MGIRRWAGRVYLVLLAALVAIAALSSPGTVLPVLALFLVAAVLHIVIHELGHAVAAWAMRYRVIRIVSGVGPPLFSAQLGPTLVELRLFPAGGHMLASARHSNDQAGARWREFLTVAGGPLATVMVILAARTVMPADLVVVGSPGNEVALSEMLQRLGWWLLIANLIPWSPQVDGAQMIALLKGSDEDIAEAADLRAIGESMHHYERGDVDAAIESTADYGDNTAAAAMHAAALSRAGRFAEARRVLVPLVGRTLPDIRRLMVANNLAWVDVNLGAPHLVCEADHWSSIAVQLAENEPPHAMAAVASTRAHVLAALCRHDEADDFFQQALDGQLDDSSRGEVLAGRARHRLARGDALGARRDVDRAVSLAPESPLVRTAGRLVDNVSLTVVADHLSRSGDEWVLSPAMTGSEAQPTVGGARRAVVDLDSPTPLLNHAAEQLGVTPEELRVVLAHQLGVQLSDSAENRSSIQAIS
ncbi:MAG: site-2 protease family protein [Acidimicrobiales bacterium]